jgi:GNAT superfamily N-acetyltransferase
MSGVLLSIRSGVRAPPGSPFSIRSCRSVSWVEFSAPKILLMDASNTNLLTLERVGLESEFLVQEILEAAPNYTLNTDGVRSIPGDGRETLTALPSGCLLSQKHVLVLRYDGRAIGVADVIQDYPDKSTAHLGLMLLREDAHGKGIGREFYRMIEKMVVEELRCAKVRLSVVDSNSVGPFWEKQGFRMTGESRPHKGRALQSVKRVMEKTIR